MIAFNAATAGMVLKSVPEETFEETTTPFASVTSTTTDVLDGVVVVNVSTPQEHRLGGAMVGVVLVPLLAYPELTVPTEAAGVTTATPEVVE